ncbi:hypothetical protein Asi03nite_34930 [Actinoplanes siamensis]|uniref:Uncharacterized protein n=1 Tax=Actinoplanes siamensis TaxID=1223317 RepID=A0A919N7W3_9ACTN|nr:hypothetical protein Asi03nite_34930 [Actinoplanes siamensis]
MADWLESLDRLARERAEAGLTRQPRPAGAAAAGVAGRPDVVVTATLSESLGGAGGMVAGAEPVIRYLVDAGVPEADFARALDVIVECAP